MSSSVAHHNDVLYVVTNEVFLTTYSTKTMSIQFLERRKIKFLISEHRFFVGLLVNDNYIVIHNKNRDLLFFCNRLFNNLFIYRVAGDLETDLLYFSYARDRIIVGNEKGEVLRKFSCADTFTRIIPVIL